MIILLVISSVLFGYVFGVRKGEKSGARQMAAYYGEALIRKGFSQQQIIEILNLNME